jgi:hypothetical protein
MTKIVSHLRGPLMSTTIGWLRKEYGDPLFQRALSRLSPEEAAQLNRPILTLGWFPISLHQKMMDACYDELCTTSPIDRDAFDRRALIGGGGAILQSLYRFVLSLMQPHNTLGRLPGIYQRAYDTGKLEVIENRPGFAILRHSGPQDLYHHAKRVNQFGLPYLLELAGAKQVSFELRRDECSDTDYTFESVIQYQ